MRSAWKQKEETQLTECFSIGLSDKEIAIILSRTADSVRMARRRLGIKHAACKPWKKESYELLSKLFLKGLSTECIAAKLGRSSRSVIYAKRKMGIPRSKRKVRNLDGLTFGRWKIIRFAGIEKYHAKYWCLCKCGTIRKKSASALIAGASKSCGCLSREVSKQVLAKVRDVMLLNPVIVMCDVCGAECLKTTSNRKYCSAKCRNEAQYTNCILRQFYQNISALTLRSVCE